jgi:hypothetical protein
MSFVNRDSLRRHVHSAFHRKTSTEVFHPRMGGANDGFSCLHSRIVYVLLAMGGLAKATALSVTEDKSMIFLYISFYYVHRRTYFQ